MEFAPYDQKLCESRNKLKFEIEKIEREIKDRVERHLQRQKESLYEQIDSLIAKTYPDVRRSAKTAVNPDDRKREKNQVPEEDSNSSNNIVQLRGPQLLINNVYFQSPFDRNFPIQYVRPNLEMDLECLHLGKVELISEQGSCHVSLPSCVEENELFVPKFSLAKTSETCLQPPVTRKVAVRQNRKQGDGNSSSDSEEDYTNVPKKGDRTIVSSFPEQPKCPAIPVPRHKDTARTRSRSAGSDTQDKQSHLLQPSYTNVSLCKGNRGMQPPRAPAVARRAMSAGATVQPTRPVRRKSEMEQVKIVNGTVCLAIGDR